jgi:hypothetical protein
MSFDLQLFQELMLVGNRYLSQAKDRAFLARKMADHWKGLAEGEERLRTSRKPSGTFSAATVDKILKGEE